jgi:type II secretion system protein C
MKKVFNFKLLNIIETTIFLLLFAKLLSLFVWWYLPEIGVEAKNNISCVMPYQRIDFKNMLEHILVKKKEIKKNISDIININDLILKGLYGNEKYGYVIIATKKHPNKTSIISIGESYQGYKLKSIYLDYVIFTKNCRDYILRLKQKKKNINRITRVSYTNKNKNTDLIKIVNRKDVTYYTHHFPEIWRDIAIDEIKQNGKLKGFIIKRIRLGSKMAQLGLQKGDIILGANNVRFSSYNDVMNLYKNIKYIDTLNLIIKRGNEEKEITYEVH